MFWLYIHIYGAYEAQSESLTQRFSFTIAFLTHNKTESPRARISKEWVANALKSFPRTPFLISNNTVAQFLGIEDDNVKGLHKVSILGRYTSNKRGRCFDVLVGVGRWQKSLESGKEVGPPVKFFSFGHAKTKYNTAANMKMLLDLVDGTRAQTCFATIYSRFDSAQTQTFMPSHTLDTSDYDISNVASWMNGGSGVRQARALAHKIFSDSRTAGCLLCDYEALTVDDAIKLACVNPRILDDRLMEAFKTQMRRMTSVGAVDFGLGLTKVPRLCDCDTSSIPPPPAVKMLRVPTSSNQDGMPMSRDHIKKQYFSTLQSVAVIEFVLDNWQEATQVLKVPRGFGVLKMRHWVRTAWSSTGLPITAGPLTRQDTGNSNRHRFDGSAIYLLVDALRMGSTKLRQFVRDLCDSWRGEYYASLSVEHQPRDDEWSIMKYLYALEVALNVTPGREYNLRRTTKAQPDVETTAGPPNRLETTAGAPPPPVIDDMDHVKVLIESRFASFKHVSNGRRTLPDAVALCLKLLTSECNVTDTNLNLVIAYVFVYLTGKPPPDVILFAMSSVVPKWRRLALADEMLEAEQFQSYFERTPNARFAVYTDDTGNKTAVYVTYPHEDPTSGTRTIKRMLLSVSAMLGGGDREHAEWTVALLRKFGFPLRRFCGGCTDHKAETEIKKTYRYICTQLGIGCLVCMWFGDYFHKVALVAEYASKVMCHDKKMKEVGCLVLLFLLHGKCYLCSTLSLISRMHTMPAKSQAVVLRVSCCVAPRHEVQ